ncbi:MAG TPA: hypothetical protein VF280_20275 [Burkholderiales bacterium]|jgi:hypothetical protein
MDEASVVIPSADLDAAMVVMGLAWLAILAMLAAEVVVESWRRLRGTPRAPFFAMLERSGVSLVQAEQVAGFAGLRSAAARCATCGSAQHCRRALRWDWMGFEMPRCPNAAFFTRVAGEPFS